MSKDIKLPEVENKRFLKNQQLWGAVLEVRLKSVGESGVSEVIESMLRDYATEAVKLNMPEQPEKELIPFDLEAAKRGEPIVTRDGVDVEFVAYIERASEYGRVVVHTNGNPYVSSYPENGRLYEGNHRLDLFMAPKPMKTVYVNFHKNGECFVYQFRSSANTAAANAMGRNPTIATAVPVQIPA